MSENSTVTTEIDVEAAISEIAEMEVSKALERVAEQSVTAVPVSETLESEVITHTEITETETEETVIAEISEFSENTFTTSTEDNISALPPETTAAAVTNETAEVTAADENVTVQPKTELAANQIIMPAVVAVLAIAAVIVKDTLNK